LYTIIVAFIIGLFVGSFLNVCIDRMPAGQSIINPPSHCSACNHPLRVPDLVPVFSYLYLRGRCRYCGATIPLRLPIVEVITGLLFAFLAWKFGLGLQLGISLVYACLIIIIFVIDLENQLVLNKLVYPSAVLALVFSFFWPGLGILSALEGGALGLAVLALIVIIYPAGMGWGDVKLAALVGLMTGFPLVVVALLLSVITGGVVGAGLLAFKVKGRKDAIPFAPFLAASAMIVLLWGKTIWQWYIL
jgi:leader peptidase (prepilin peptidase)/N-methyltransferase